MTHFLLVSPTVWWKLHYTWVYRQMCLRRWASCPLRFQSRLTISHCQVKASSTSHLLQHLVEETKFRGNATESPRAPSLHPSLLTEQGVYLRHRRLRLLEANHLWPSSILRLRFHAGSCKSRRWKFPSGISSQKVCLRKEAVNKKRN